MTSVTRIATATAVSLLLFGPGSLGTAASGPSPDVVEAPWRVLEEGARHGDLRALIEQAHDRRTATPALIRSVVPLGAEHMAAVAWLEGEDGRSLEVKISWLDGERLGEIVTVSPRAAGSQTTLTGAVLGDGTVVLVWAQNDGDDDEIVWARSLVDGSFSAPRRIGADDDVPDITPHVLAVDGVVFVAWNEFSDGTYRVRAARIDGADATALDIDVPPGSVYPGLSAADGGAYLVFRVAPTSQWAVIELGADGRVGRSGAVASERLDRPEVVVDGALVLGWPDGTTALATEPVVRAALVDHPSATASQNLTGIMKVIAFGDSITAGVFDEAGIGGYPPRLQNVLSARGIPSTVINRGQSGETTAGGVARISQALTGGGDVMVLMEGTNDVSQGVSIESMLFNLEAMAATATAYGMKTVDATIIPRLPTAINDRDSSYTSLLGQYVRYQARTNGREFADPFDAFWRTPNRFQTIYYQGSDPVGHPNGAGYQFMAEVIAERIAQRGKSMAVGNLDGVGANEALFDLGAYGIYARDSANTWRRIHALTTEALATTDIDGDGASEIVFDFGPTYGLYIYLDDQSWQVLHPKSPDSMLVGDLNNDGRDEVILDLGPGSGTWIFDPASSFRQLHNWSVERMAIGNIDGILGDDLVLDFGADYGLYVYYNNSTWTSIHPQSAREIVTGDLDGNGQDDIVVHFGYGSGIWILYNGSIWDNPHWLSPKGLAIGDLDYNSREDLVVNFGGALGLYVLYDGVYWQKIHSAAVEEIAVVDSFTGGPGEELMVDFGPVYGTYVFEDSSRWFQLHPLSVELTSDAEKR